MPTYVLKNVECGWETSPRSKQASTNHCTELISYTLIHTCSQYNWVHDLILVVRFDLSFDFCFADLLLLLLFLIEICFFSAAFPFRVLLMLFVISSHKQQFVFKQYSIQGIYLRGMNEAEERTATVENLRVFAL